MAKIAQLQITSDSHLRSAVATSLKQWFENEVILEALCVIEESFDHARQSNFGVIVIINALADYFAWSRQMKHDVRVSLYRNMLPGASLDPDPLDALNAYKKTRTPGEKTAFIGDAGHSLVDAQAAINDDIGSQKPELVVFCQLIYSLRKIMSANFAAQFAIFEEVVKEEVEVLNIGPHLRSWVYQVLFHSKGGVLNIKLAGPEMSSVVHAFYNAVAEAVGPMEADKVLTSAVTQTEKTPAALHFSPKNFL